MTGSRSRVVAGGPGRAAPDLYRAAAERLTDRDRYLCRILAEHRVLTTDQMVDIAFDSAITARHRLGVLTSLRLLDRFRPYRPTGSA
ncbi:MAG: replication-relaxation family protein, partial [Nocardioidaceae bacterium]